MEEVISIFGAPTYLVLDQGIAFTAKSFRDMCKENEVKHIRNAMATPRANGQVEHHNRTILTAITTMTQREDGKDWDIYAPFSHK